MQQEKINQLTSSRSVGMRDINALFAPISRICCGPQGRDDEVRSTNVGQVLPDNRSCFCPPCGESAPLGAKGGLIKRAFFSPPSALQATSSAREEGNRGFTLIELLVVVLIIGILAAIALPQYQLAVEKSRAMQGIVITRALHDAQEAYYLEHGNYATSQDALDVQVMCPANYICTVTDNVAKVQHNKANWYIAYSYDNRSDNYAYTKGNLFCWNGHRPSVCDRLGERWNDMNNNMYLLN